MEQNIKTFKDRPWPFVPECLSEIIPEDVLEIIQTGISLKHNIPLLIVEFRDGEPKEIKPIKPRIEFCERFRAIELPDGTRPSDESCRICDYDAAQRYIKRGTTEIYKCHMGITEVIVPILVANKVVAVFFADQIVYEHEKWAIGENLKDWNRGVCSIDEECMKKLENSGVLKKTKLIPCKEIDRLIKYVKEKMKSHTSEYLKGRKSLMETYAKVVSNLANAIYSGYKWAQEKEFLYMIASIFETSEATDIEGLKKIVSDVLDKTCNFCGASSAILFANQDRGASILPVFETIGINTEIKDIHLNLNKIKGDLSKPVFIEEAQRWGIRGEAAKEIEGFMLLPVSGTEYKVSLALNHPSPNTVIAESGFFDALMRNVVNHLRNFYAEQERKEQIVLTFHTMNQSMDTLLGKSTYLYREVSKEEPDKEELKDTARGIEADVKSLERMVRTVYYHTAIGTEAEEYRFDKPFSLVKLIEDCRDRYLPFAQNRGINIDIRKETYIPKVFWDRDKMDVAISNIVHNAVKFSHYNKDITIWLCHSDGTVYISVHNFGFGIAKEDKKDIFNQFIRSKIKDPRRPIPGFGVGLSIAKRFIEKHGGTINVVSQKLGTEHSLFETKADLPDFWEGFNTNFTINLPVNPEKGGGNR